MKKSRFFLSFLSISVLHWLLNVGVYGVLLRNRYGAFEQVSREPMNMALFPFQSLVYGLLFVTLFSRGFTPSKPRVQQGIVFGLLIGVFLAVSVTFANYGIYRFYTLSLAIEEAAAILAVAAVLGVLVGRIYK